MTKAPHLENGIAAEPAMTGRDNIPAAELADRLRLWADADVMETARDGTFEYNDAVKWAGLMVEAADMLERLASRPFADHEAVRQRAVEDERDRLFAIASHISKGKVAGTTCHEQSEATTVAHWLLGQGAEHPRYRSEARAALRKPANEEGGGDV